MPGRGKSWIGHGLFFWFSEAIIHCSQGREEARKEERNKVRKEASKQGSRGGREGGREGGRDEMFLYFFRGTNLLAMPGHQYLLVKINHGF